MHKCTLIVSVASLGLLFSKCCVSSVLRSLPCGQLIITYCALWDFVPDTIAPYFLSERTTTLGLNRIVTDPKLFPNLTLHAHDLFVMNILRMVLYKLFQKKTLSLFNFFNRKKLILYDESTKSLTTGEKGGNKRRWKVISIRYFIYQHIIGMIVLSRTVHFDIVIFIIFVIIVIIYEWCYSLYYLFTALVFNVFMNSVYMTN